MKRYVAAGVLLVLLAIGAGVLSHIWPQRERIYSVATVVQGLAWHPAVWAGRTLLVRATVIDTRQLVPSAPNARVVMTPPLPAQDSHTTTLGDRTLTAQMASQGQTLTLVTRPPAGLLVALRRLPVVGVLVPPPQRGSTFSSGLYRVQLAGAAQSCLPLHRQRLSRAALLKTLHLPRRRGCYDGVLLDYQP